VPLAPVEGSVLTCAGYVAYPRELYYPQPAKTTEPAMVARERAAAPGFFPGDVDRSAWRSGHADSIAGLLQNASSAGSPVRARPVRFDGDGVRERFVGDGGGHASMCELTRTGKHKGRFARFYSIGDRCGVRFTLPASAKSRRLAAAGGHGRAFEL
jgi:hypothetical protein